MREYMDDLLREAFHEGVEMASGLEQDTVQKMTDKPQKRLSPYKNIRRDNRMRVRPVLAALCMALLMGSAVTVYAAASGLTVGQLFSNIWDKSDQSTALEGINTEVNVLEEESTFQNISIEPVQVVSDSYITYLVLKVEGKNGFRLTDEMTFDVFSVEDRQKGVNSLNAFVLKREGNTMYVALRNSTKQVKKYRDESFSIDIYNLYYAVLDEMGRCVKVKNMVDETVEKNGDGVLRYTQASIAAEGEYHAKITCAVQNEKLKISTEDFGTFEVRPLSVLVDGDISDQVGGILDAGSKKCDVFIIMEDGREVQAELDGGTEVSTEFELREPIDLKNVKGIRVLNHVYDAGIGEKQ